MPVLTLLTEQIFARVPGGTGRYTREVAAAVATSAPVGWAVHGRVAWHRDRGPARLPGVVGPQRFLVDARILSRLWERGLPPTVAGDVVHALTPLAPPRLRRGQSLIVTVHDTVPYTHPETLTPRGAAWHRVMIERAARTAVALVVPTHAVARALTEIGITARIEVIGEGVAPALSASMTDDAAKATRRRLGLPDRYLLTVGTLEPRKGLDVLLDALTLAPAADASLAVVGQSGWGGTDITAAVRARGLSDRVKVLGRIADEELAAVLAGAAVSLVPSRSEGFGLSLLEAMSAGVPVIHSDAAALVEVAGGAGRCVPVGDARGLAEAIGAVLEDESLASALAAAGRRRALLYTWPAVAGQLWDLYRDVAGSSSQ